MVQRGENRTLWAKASTLRNEMGDIIGAIESIRDITKYKRTEEALLESEEKYRNFVEHTTDWVWEIDSEGKFIYCNENVSDILGFQHLQDTFRHRMAPW